MRYALAFILFLSSLGQPASAMAVPKADLAGFRKDVAPLLREYCVDCHGATEPDADLSLESIDANVISGADFEKWRLIQEQIQFGKMPPEDEDQPSATQRATMLRWVRTELLKTQQPGVVTNQKLLLPEFGNYVDHEALFGKRLPRVYPAPPRIWRLRPAIYDRVVPSVSQGERVEGLANGLNVRDGSEIKDYATTYFLDEAATAPLLSNAKKIAATIVGPKSRMKACKQLSAEKPPVKETVEKAIEEVFRGALGRAPTSEESERFAAFHRKATNTGGHKPAGTALVAAILMQPEVLYRQELGDGKPDEHGRVRLAQRELAYALSYALSDAPLSEFQRAASEGKLASSAHVERIVKTRLEDPSRLQDKNPRVLQFFREYLHYPFANEVFKDKPEGGDHDPGRLVADFETVVRDILREDKQVLATLLTTRKFYVQAAYKSVKREGVKLVSTANNGKKSFYHTAYSLPLDWKWSLHLQPVVFPADERAGVLTHPAWLAAWSGNFENHPVQRGKWIRTHLLGGTVPDVPIGVDARVPEKEGMSFRSRLKLATKDATCWRCHRKMDPLGVAFERYDHYGRYQRLDAGQPVDASCQINFTGVPELDGKTFSGPTELMDFLAKSEHVEEVFVRHVFRYFMGRNETLGDANTLQDAHQAYRESGGSFKTLVTSILCSDSFLYRQTGSSNGFATAME